MKPPTREAAGKIWDILVECAGAYDSKRERDSFIHYQLKGCTEYRFGGKLGFGGKFWNNASMWYVNCYKEDLTPELEKIIEDTNTRLKALYEAT